MLGNGGSDRLDGGAGDDALAGGDDGDALFGGDGSDFLFGGIGNDRIDGGLGSDRAFFTGNAAATVNLSLLGAQVTGHPVTFAVDGKQYVAVSTGRSNMTGGLTRLTPEVVPADSANKLFVFALPH